MPSTPQSPQKLLKILCLHGYRQNEEIFRQKTGGLRRTLKNYAKFDFINAPHVVPAGDEITSKEENDSTETGGADTYGWWLFPKDEVSGEVRCEGLEKSVQLFEETSQEKGPYDGILAFSQGATFAGILSIFQQEKRLKAEFRFVIIIAGAQSLWEPLTMYNETIIDLPSLHIIGETDQIIARARSEKFLRCFSNPKYQTHPGGHYVPANASLKKHYIEFLKEQQSTENVPYVCNN